MGSKPLPEFETDRLYMRGVRLEDSESYEKNFANYEVVQHLSDQVPWPYPEGSTKSFLESVIIPKLGIDRWLWVMFLKDNRNEVIGCVDLWREGCPEHRGFWLAKEHWGKGLMTEAVQPVMDYAFDHLGFEKLVFSNAAGNDRSKRVKEKTGATYIGNRPAKFASDQYAEAETWELTKENWKKFTSKKIYHITKRDNWNKAKEKGSYDFCSLSKDGFIHCSAEDQVMRIANGIFRGQSDLVLLEIDKELVKSKIVYENLEGGDENFPHIYGPINVNAVLRILDLRQDKLGEFISLG